MKEVLVIIFMIFPFLSFPQSNKWNKIDNEIFNNSCIIYLQNDSIPYTGILVDRRFLFRKDIYVINNGNIVSDTTYRRGLINSYCIWYYDSNQADTFPFDKKCYFNKRNHLSYEVEIKDGNFHGEYIKYHKNGNIISTGYLINGQVQGHWTYYRKDGTKMCEGNVVNGKDDGIWQYYNINGVIDYTEVYKNGKKIKE